MAHLGGGERRGQRGDARKKGRENEERKRKRKEGEREAGGGRRGGQREWKEIRFQRGEIE